MFNVIYLDFVCKVHSSTGGFSRAEVQRMYNLGTLHHVLNLDKLIS